MPPLSQTAAQIFRITHIDNVLWTLKNGLHCRSSATVDPNYRNIGNLDLIDKRKSRRVPIPPAGTLSDYIPFYFTSRSPMFYNIKTGVRVPAVAMNKIVIMVSSLPKLAALKRPFVFTDRHAYLVTARFSCDLADLGMIDWNILQRSDFKYDANDMDKMDRYQAEALVHQHLPVDALSALICYDAAQASRVRALADEAGCTIRIVTNSGYFF